MEKLFFYDTETTGTDVRVHAAHQIAGCIRIDGKVVERFNFNITPPIGTEIDPYALAVSGLVLSDMHASGRLSMSEAYVKIIEMLSRYVDRYNKTDKFHLVGFNNRGFDDNFFRKFFQQNNDSYFGSWFWADTFDVLCLASRYLKNVRHTMENFKQATVAKKLGISVEELRLHDAEYDTEVLVSIYDKVTSLYSFLD